MRNIQILENNDVIKSGDWVRPLALQYSGQSDTLLTTNTYSGRRMNRLGWITVDEYMPFFVGKTLRDFYKKKGYYPSEQLEIVRGDIPEHHKEDNVTYWHISSFNKPTASGYEIVVK
jgi:hypothetical protein